MATRYFISIPDPAKAHASGEFAFRSQGADGLAQEFQDALQGDGLFERWRLAQDEPDDVQPVLGATDPSASVTGRQHDDGRADLVATTSLPGDVLKHRLRLLAGNAWELRDVTAA